MSETLSFISNDFLELGEIAFHLEQWESCLNGFQSQVGLYSDSLFMEPQALPDKEVLSNLRTTKITIEW